MNDMPAPVRFGILGCGVISETHAAAITGLPDAELAAVADPVSERAAALAERYGVPAFDSLSSMLEGEDLDVVNVCTASGMHGKHAREAMRAGKHVMVEKPLEISLEQIDQTLEVQREARVKLAAVCQHRFDPAAIRIHDLLTEGAFGTLVLANAQILWWRSQQYYDAGGWRGTSSLDGGGVLMNQSIHSIDLLHWFMGRVRSVSAYTATMSHDIETEDTAAAALRFASGALGSISATTSGYPGVVTRLEILGTGGSAILENDRLRYLHLSQDEVKPVGLYGLEGMPLPAAPEQQAPGGAHDLQIADFIRAIREDGMPLVDGESARHDVAIILAIYESARTGKEVLVS
jgi:UDP-N-acetyl-2-amino-2-deoxyglucuronate dehydrogenase